MAKPVTVTRERDEWESVFLELSHRAFHHMQQDGSDSRWDRRDGYRFTLPTHAEWKQTWPPGKLREEWERLAGKLPKRAASTKAAAVTVSPYSGRRVTRAGRLACEWCGRSLPFTRSTMRYCPPTMSGSKNGSACRTAAYRARNQAAVTVTTKGDQR